MASILPIVGTVAGSFFGPVGGAIGGGIGSLAGSAIEKEGKLEGEDVGKAALSAGLGYIGGGGFSGAGAEAAGAAGAGAAGAGAGGAAATEAAAAAIPAVPAGATAGTAFGTSAPGLGQIAPVVANMGAATPAAAPALAAAPAAAGTGAAGAGASAAPMWRLPAAGADAIRAPNIPATGEPSWLGRPGMMGMTRGENIGYGGLAALGSMGSMSSPKTDERHYPAPRLASSPTQRRFSRTPEGYRPGVDPEHNYFAAARGGLVPGFYEGGEIEGGMGAEAEASAADASAAASASNASQAADAAGALGNSVGATGDPWGAGISSFGSSQGPDAGPGPGMGGGVGGGEGGGPPLSLTAPALAAAPDDKKSMFSSTPQQREYVSPGAGYRPGYDPQAILFKDMASPVQQMASGGSVSGGRVTIEPGGTYMTMPDGSRYIQKKEKDFGWDRMLGIPGLLGMYAGTDESWEPTERAPPVLATTPINRNFTPAPKDYRHGYQDEWKYFNDPVPGQPQQEGMAEGGLANASPRLLQGEGDGLSDSIRGSIDGQEPVDLSSGEFVIPAWAVSGLGNGSTEAGARKLHRMMARIRAARESMGDEPIDEEETLPA